MTGDVAAPLTGSVAPALLAARSCATVEDSPPLFQLTQPSMPNLDRTSRAGVGLALWSTKIKIYVCPIGRHIAPVSSHDVATGLPSPTGE